MWTELFTVAQNGNNPDTCQQVNRWRKHALSRQWNSDHLWQGVKWCFVPQWRFTLKILSFVKEARWKRAAYCLRHLYEMDGLLRTLFACIIIFVVKKTGHFECYNVVTLGIRFSPLTPGFAVAHCGLSLFVCWVTLLSYLGKDCIFLSCVVSEVSSVSLVVS